MRRLYFRSFLATATALAAALTTLSVGTAEGAQRDTTVVRTGEPTAFTLSSFNVLGSTHTGPNSRFASGVERMSLTVKLLDRHGVDVVGFQELQMDQWAEFTRLAGDRFGVYPGGISRRAVQNSVAWSLDMWEQVAEESFLVDIPYFNGDLYPMPVVLLRNKVTGVEAWFANFHNPATNRKHRNSTKYRMQAVALETALANRLIAESDRPLFITGDMNDREKFYCAMAGGAPMKAANGGKFKDGVCTPPPYPMPVNWIMGAKTRGKFTNYVRDDSKLVNKITDHFVIRADVTIKPTAVVSAP
ncbi:MAG: endonuclease/exonuclease/phosphatase family protein [Nocardioides sp.]